MVTKQDNSKLLSEEEDHTWPKNETTYKGSHNNNRTAMGLIILVGECFIPETVIKQFKKLFKRQKEKHVRYS